MATAEPSAANERRPFAEYEPVRYVVLGANLSFQYTKVKKEILSNLPSGITAVVYSVDKSDEEAFKKAMADLSLSDLQPLALSCVLG